MGDRSEASCQDVWRKVLTLWHTATGYGDCWGTHRAVIPAAQHRASRKGSGQTSHVKRGNNTLCQRLGQFVRKTLAFSQSDAMPDARITLFLHRYNRERT